MYYHVYSYTVLNFVVNRHNDNCFAGFLLLSQCDYMWYYYFVEFK